MLGAAVPEASVDEHGDLATREYDVRAYRATADG